MSEHTLGPWTVHEEAAIDYRPCNIFGAAGGSHVATCMGGGRKRAIDKAEERANARLIAAAPDLLAAAAAVIDGHNTVISCGGAGGPFKRHMEEPLFQLRAAIAKATGQGSGA